MSEKLEKMMRRMEANCARLGANTSVNYFMRGIPLNVMEPPDPGWLALYKGDPESFEQCDDCGGKGFVNWDTVNPNERCEDCKGVGHRRLTADDKSVL